MSILVTNCYTLKEKHIEDRNFRLLIGKHDFIDIIIEGDVIKLRGSHQLLIRPEVSNILFVSIDN